MTDQEALMPTFKEVKEQPLLEGQMNKHLPPKTVAQVWSELTIPELLQYAATLTFNYISLQDAISSSLHRHIQIFPSESYIYIYNIIHCGHNALFPG